MKRAYLIVSTMCGRAHAWLGAITLWRKALTPPQESVPSDAERRARHIADTPESKSASNKHRLDKKCRENSESKSEATSKQQLEELLWQPVMQELDSPPTGIMFEIDDVFFDYSDEDCADEDCGIFF